MVVSLALSPALNFHKFRNGSVKPRPIPKDVRLWGIHVVSGHLCRQAQPQGQLPPNLWHDVILTADTRYPVEPTVEVHVYAVRPDGFVVYHHIGAHNPASVFRVYAPGDVAKLRLFADTEMTVLLGWPAACRGIPRERGMAVVIAHHEGGRTSRHMFRFAEECGHLWATKRQTPKVIDLPGNHR